MQEASSEDKLVNNLQLEFKNIKNDIFENGNNSKFIPKTFKTKN